MKQLMTIQETVEFENDRMSELYVARTERGRARIRFGDENEEIRHRLATATKVPSHKTAGTPFPSTCCVSCQRALPTVCKA